MAESPLATLHRLGQSPWLDFISREMLESGEMEALFRRYAIRGVTSNPAIFEKSMKSGDAYDADIERLAREGRDTGAIYEVLALDDVGRAADLLRPLYDESGGGDGFVSIEVSPHLARDTEGTLEEARRLWKALARPNVMIKVPGTEEGLPAIRRLLAEGVNVNITLLFGLGRYAEVAEAFVGGLEDRVRGGGSPEGVASVASFFLSRIDTLVDPELEGMAEAGGSTGRSAAKLRGEAAIACARRAYAHFQEVFGSERFRALRERGARPQRLLWASTGTKNPDYSDVKYVEPLIGPDTVNTLTLDTIEAYDDHGDPKPRIQDDPDGARRVADDLAELGIDLESVAERLVEEGIRKFVEPFDASLQATEAKRAAALGRA